MLRRGAFDMLLAVVLACAGCAPSEPDPPAPWGGPGAAAPVRATRGSVSPPIEIGPVGGRGDLRFREVDGAWMASQASYEVRRTAESLRITPVRDSLGDGVGRETTSVAPVSFRTRSVARAGRELATESREPFEAKDGSLVVPRGSVVETVRIRPSGVRLEWQLAAHPEGGGALEVVVDIGGATYSGASRSGLHFEHRPSGLGLRFGAATWVDAGGKSQRVPLRYADDTIRISIPAEVVDGSAYPVVIDPVISPELGMDEPIESRASGSQSPGGVAYDGVNHLVVWQNMHGEGSSIRATRVSATGDVLDLDAIRISPPGVAAHSPTVAFDGANYLVVWEDGRSATPDIFSDSDLYAARVTPDGTVLDEQGFAVSTAPESQRTPRVTFGDTQFLVVWSDERNGWVGRNDVYAARVEPDGTVLDPGGIPVSVGDDYDSEPVVAFSGSVYMVAWEQFSAEISIFARALDVNGAPIGPSTSVSTGNYSTTPGLASNGDGFLAAWFRNGGGVRARRFDDLGSMIGAELTLSTGLEGGYVDVGGLGSDYLVAWADHMDEIRAARVTSTGEVPGSAAIVVSPGGSQWTPRVGGSPSGAFVAWTQSRLSLDALGARIAVDGTVLDAPPINLAWSANEQSAPQASAGPGGFLAIWRDTRGPSYSWGLYGTRLGPAGAVLDPNGIPLETDFGTSPHQGSVASNGTSYLVAFGQQPTVGFRMVEADGTVSPAQSIPAPLGSGGEPKVGTDGTGYYIVWASWDIDFSRIRGVAVSASGSMIGQPAELAFAPGQASGNPVVTFDGTSYVVAWNEGGSQVPFAVKVMRVAPDGTPETGSLPVVEGTEAIARPAMASNTGTSMVVWQDSRSGDEDIYAARMSADGTVLDPGGVPVVIAAGAQTMPAVAFDGVRFVLAWQEESGDLRGAYVGLDATVQETFPISDFAHVEERSPALTAAGAGRVLAVYERFDPSPPFEAWRVRGRFILDGCADGTMPGCCAVHADCDDGRACTIDTCDDAAHACVYSDVPGCCESDEECSDGDACTVNRCKAGVCESVLLIACADAGDSSAPDGASDAMTDASLDATPDGAPDTKDALDADEAGLDAPSRESDSAGDCACRVPPRSTRPSRDVPVAVAALLLALCWRRKQRARTEYRTRT